MSAKMATKFLFFLLGIGVILLPSSCKAADFQSNVCTDPNSNVCSVQPNCPASASCFAVHWKDFKPYAYKDANGALKGVIPGMLEFLFSSCCPSCWRANLTVVQKSEANNVADLVFPGFVRTSEVSDTHEGMHFVSLLDDVDVVYITKTPDKKGIPKKLMQAIWNAWPVLVVALLLSLHAGVLLWLLEFWGNRDEFPASFSKGSWEGFWWAFVSMTTVGYGDRAPRSILGRGFAICWILVGICICSIFTATLTTALTTISLEEVKKLSRAKVGAVKDSVESYIGAESQAKVISFNTSEELWTAFRQDRVEGILLDSHHSATPALTNKIENDNLKISETVSANDWSYGVFVKDNNLSDCFKTALGDEYDGEIYNMIGDEIESEKAATDSEATKRSSSMFDPTGDVFYPTLYTCIGFTCIVIAFGLIWEFAILPKLKRKIDPNESCGNAPNMDIMEKEMVLEVQRLFADWRARLEEKTAQTSAGAMDMT